MTMETIAAAGLDPALLPYLRAERPADEDRALEELVLRVDPLIRRIIRRKAMLFAGAARQGYVTREAELGEDLHGAAMVQLLAKLNQLKIAFRAGDPGDPDESSDAGIRSLVGLAESITHSVLTEHLRKKYPQRASLKNQIIYVLRNYQDAKTGKTRFALWYVERERLCGLLEWLGRALAVTRRYEQLRAGPYALARELAPSGDPVSIRLSQLLESVFLWLGSPLDLDELVGVVGQLRGVKDQPEVSLEGSTGTAGSDDEARMAEPAGTGPTPEQQVVMRAALQQIWTHICRLSPAQCAVLLLNLTDSRGKGVIDLLPVLGIATLRQIAGAMELPVERLAELWPSLPLDDREIGDLLHCPPGRVAVTRWRARQRLEAAMQGAE